MKMENFSAAVEFYSKAISVNPQNAVYFCNRWGLFISSLRHQAAWLVSQRADVLLCAELQHTASWETTLEPCRTASRPSASTPTTAKPTAGWGRVPGATVAGGNGAPPTTCLKHRFEPVFVPAKPVNLCVCVRVRV